MKQIKKTKGVKTTKLASLALSHAKTTNRSSRVFTYENVPGCFVVGATHDCKINLTYWTKHPSNKSGNESVRFQVYRGTQVADTYATNFDKVSALIYNRYRINVYSYNEVAKKQAKERTKEKKSATWARLTTAAKKAFSFIFKTTA